MPDRFVAILLRLYPEEFRARFGPQIEADLYHPCTNRPAALFDILRSALYHRVTSPGPYIGIAAILLSASVIAFSGTVTLRNAYRLLQPRTDSQTHLYALLFCSVFLVVLSVLLLAIHWLRKCSKSTA
jgi:surface polysaccharide O-acyltransferase-like enzyme